MTAIRPPLKLETIQTPSKASLIIEGSIESMAFTDLVEMADHEVPQKFQVESEDEMKLIFEKLKVDLEDWRRQLKLDQDDIFTSSSRSRNKEKSNPRICNIIIVVIIVIIPHQTGS